MLIVMKMGKRFRNFYWRLAWYLFTVICI